MIVLYLTLTLHAPWSRSLKDKRSISRSIIARLRASYNASVCEVAAQDKHQLIELAVAALAFDHAQADSIAQNMADAVVGMTDAELIRVEREYR